MTCPTFQTSGETIPREIRADIMKSYNADLAISIHIDSNASPNLHGATAYITALPKYNSEMRKLANQLLTNLTKLGIASNGIKLRPTESNDGYYDDGTPLDYYGIIRYPTLHNIPIVLLEHCYISNTSDCKFIDSAEDLKNLAKADSDAIASYLNLKKKSGQGTNKVEITQDTKIEGVTLSGLDIIKGYIRNILAGETVLNLKSKIKTDYTVTITDKNGNSLIDKDYIPNASRVTIKAKDKNIATFINTVYGDIDCNGQINSIDLLVLQRHILGIATLNEDIVKAGNISKDGSSPTSIDLLKIQRHILGISTIK